MALFGPTTKSLQDMYDEFSVDRKSIQESVECLKEWLRLQPHLPDAENDRRLERVLCTSKFSVERAKRSLDAYYSLRNHVPELLEDRDPCGPALQASMDIMTFVPLPRLTSQGRRVSLFRLEHVPASKIDVLLLCKLALMVSEVRLAEDTSLGDILVFDLEGITLGHLVKFSVPVFRKLELCVTSAFNVRVSAMHYVNAPNFVDKLLTVLKTVLKPKVAARIHVHSKEAGLSDLYKHVPPSLLPTEYGGDAGSLIDMKAAWRTKLESYREWFLEQESVKSDESRRPGKPVTSSDLLGFEGTFRQLNVD